ncbi:hypothetical protein DDZ16_18190 [Marinilabilia rubra]|uniref:Uncharacterized protein n=1 Tax=Marinilabilia rubra TaxID=2162893 RepID=A0A2U2B496_9BACT|nr:hypothetical protein DDZ16_18190 [Marinilabilia rubra]
MEGSENEDAHWPMDFYTFDLPSEFFDFPDDVLNQTSSFNDCGPSFFPEYLKSNYRIRFQYRESHEKEKIKFSCGPCTAFFPSFPWNYYNQISLKNISKVN